MYNLIRLVKSLRQDRRAVTALEYGLIAGSIALAILVSVQHLGTTISNVFSTLAGTNWG